MDPEEKFKQDIKIEMDHQRQKIKEARRKYEEAKIREAEQLEK